MNVKCPHCSTKVSNDGSLAGQVVSCPTCQGRFQMPLLDSDPPKSSKPLLEFAGNRVNTPNRSRPDSYSEPWYYGFTVFTAYALLVLGPLVAVFSIVGAIASGPTLSPYLEPEEISRLKRQHSQLEAATAIYWITVAVLNLITASLMLIFADIGRSLRIRRKRD